MYINKPFAIDMFALLLQIYVEYLYHDWMVLLMDFSIIQTIALRSIKHQRILYYDEYSGYIHICQLCVDMIPTNFSVYHCKCCK